ncbi:hypothetical protein DPMN_113127 [Dreissena polymorpha]|uniref:Uncharacterized protein n=1 Tax=Dreissena polymorpha TaxID=45954 RepID=A0A9D4KHQ7_DREPO|nr:hypothetical protein DPMN_113127 [Dreissena polymorpha]
MCKRDDVRAAPVLHNGPCHVEGELLAPQLFTACTLHTQSASLLAVIRKVSELPVL